MCEKHSQFLSPLQFSFNSLSCYDLTISIIPTGTGTTHNPRSKSYCFICGSSIPGQMITANITLLLKSGLGSFKQGHHEKTETTALFHTVQVTPIYFYSIFLHKHICLEHKKNFPMCSMCIRTVITSDNYRD